MSGGKLDLQPIHRAIRGSGNETLFFLLDDAISLLPPAKLRQLLAQYLKPEQFASDVAVKRDLFADDRGSWMVGIDWKQVLPAWFRVLSVKADPAEYARRIETFVDRHCNYQRAELLAEAGQVATPSQRKELAER